MPDDKPEQFVDELLEASLKRYGGEEPRAGLELRVLTGVRSRQSAARRRRWVWALAVCGGTLAAIVLVLHSAHAPGRHRVTSASVPQQTTNPAASPGSAESRLGSPRLVHAHKEKPGIPKPVVRATRRPEQFPTPMPLTEQEKLMLAYLAKVTKADSAAATSEHGADEVTVSELKISEVNIGALEIKPLDDSQSEAQK